MNKSYSPYKLSILSSFVNLIFTNLCIFISSAERKKNNQIVCFTLTSILYLYFIIIMIYLFLF